MGSAVIVDEFPEGIGDLDGIGAGEDGDAAVFNEGDRALGVFAHCDAGGAEDAAFLLEPAAVGEHYPRRHIELEHGVVADGVDEDVNPIHLEPPNDLHERGQLAQ